MLLIATATHVVSLGAASLVVVAMVLKLLPVVDAVGVPRTNDPLLLVVQLIGGPDTIVVNKDDEVVVSETNVEVSAGNEVTIDVMLTTDADVEVSMGVCMGLDVVLTTVAELEYPPYEADVLLYVCRWKLISPVKFSKYSPSSKKSEGWRWSWGWGIFHMDGVFQPVQ